MEKKLCGLKSYVIKNQESIDIIDILHFYENSTSRWYVAYEIVQTAKILEKNGLTFQDFWRRTY